MHEVMWSQWDGPGLEHLRLATDGSDIVADGVIITTLFEVRPIRLRYQVRCDERWRVRDVRVEAEGEQPTLTLRADGEGRWTTGDGDALPALAGCIDVDIMATPFTNTLPIRRLGLRPGDSADLSVAYVKVPSLEVVAAPQCYTCLESRRDGGRYRYQSLDTGYTNDLPVDADGLVIDYPGIWRRARPLTANS